jgi:hypothetical protein
MRSIKWTNSQKNMFAVALGGGLTILGGIITKVLEFWFAILQEKRNFRRSRKEKECAEIEELKNQIGAFYELCIKWDDYRDALPDFAAFSAKEHDVLGRANKNTQRSGRQLATRLIFAKSSFPM